MVTAVPRNGSILIVPFDFLAVLQRGLALVPFFGRKIAGLKKKQEIPSLINHCCHLFRILHVRCRGTFLLATILESQYDTDPPTFSGNFYAITNNATKPARIFFAQGCEVAPESAGFDESGAA